MSYPTTNQNVKLLADVKLTGDIIPSHWYELDLFKTVKKQNCRIKTTDKSIKMQVVEVKKTNRDAILVMAGILYWFRPHIVKDEKTGKVVGFNQKFKADMLQRSYQDTANLYDMTYNEAREVIRFLVSKNVIKQIIVPRYVVNGEILYNVQFIDLVPETINTLVHLGGTVQMNPTPPVQMNPTPPVQMNPTYTESSPKISLREEERATPPLLKKVLKENDKQNPTLNSNENSSKKSISNSSNQTLNINSTKTNPNFEIIISYLNIFLNENSLQFYQDLKPTICNTINNLLTKHNLSTNDLKDIFNHIKKCKDFSILNLSQPLFYGGWILDYKNNKTVQQVIKNDKLYKDTKYMLSHLEYTENEFGQKIYAFTPDKVGLEKFKAREIELLQQDITVLYNASQDERDIYFGLKEWQPRVFKKSRNIEINQSNETNNNTGFVRKTPIFDEIMAMGKSSIGKDI